MGLLCVVESSVPPIKRQRPASEGDEVLGLRVEEEIHTLSWSLLMVLGTGNLISSRFLFIAATIGGGPGLWLSATVKSLMH